MKDLKAVLEVAAALAESPAQWWISSGWASTVGRVTASIDIDVVTCEKIGTAVRAMELIVRQIIPHPEDDGQGTLQEWPDGMFLLPVLDHVFRPGDSGRRFNMFGESRIGWIYRRSARARAKCRSVRAVEIPYGPVVLLFKAN